jgi:GTP-binding protein
VVDLLAKRKGEMLEMGPADTGDDMSQMKFLVPTRGLIGVRSALLTATKGLLLSYFQLLILKL